MRKGGRLRAAAGVLAVCLGAVACATIPDHGRVRIGRPVQPDTGLVDVVPQAYPAAAVPGLAPGDLVRYFLRAVVSPESDFDIARSYLTTEAAGRWHPRAAITTYADEGVQLGLHTDGSAVDVQFTAPRTGRIDARGDFTPEHGMLHVDFRLVRQRGEWRIDRLPRRVLLSVSDTQRSFSLAEVYYLDRSDSILVPEQLLIRNRQGLATALVGALLHGPGPWLRPAVHSGVPAGLELLGNVPVDEAGTAVVNLSAGVRRAPAAAQQALAAQLVWTLHQVSGVTGVELQAEGVPVSVGGRPLRQTVAMWPGYDPRATSARTLLVRGRNGWSTAAGKRLGWTKGMRLTAVAPQGEPVAGVVSGRRRDRLLAGVPADLRHVLRAPSIDNVTFDRAGELLVQSGARYRLIDAGGRVHDVAVPDVLAHRQATAVRLSPDGARIAVVAGAGRRAQLLVGRLRAGREAFIIDGLRRVLPRTTAIRSVAWAEDDRLVVTAASSAGGRELLTCDVDGYTSSTVATVGVRGEPLAAAAAPGAPYAVETPRGVWLDDTQHGWRRVSAGAVPRYPG